MAVPQWYNTVPNDNNKHQIEYTDHIKCKARSRNDKLAAVKGFAFCLGICAVCVCWGQCVGTNIHLMISMRLCTQTPYNSFIYLWYFMHVISTRRPLENYFWVFKRLIEWCVIELYGCCIIYMRYIVNCNTFKPCYWYNCVFNQASQLNCFSVRWNVDCWSKSMQSCAKSLGQIVLIFTFLVLLVIFHNIHELYLKVALITTEFKFSPVLFMLDSTLDLLEIAQN